MLKYGKVELLHAGQVSLSLIFNDRFPKKIDEKKIILTKESVLKEFFGMKQAYLIK